MGVALWVLWYVACFFFGVFVVGPWLCRWAERRDAKRRR